MNLFQIQCRNSQKLQTNGQYQHYFLAQSIPGFIYNNFCYQANYHGIYIAGFYNSKIDDKNGNIPLPLIIFTRTPLGQAPVQWHINAGVHLKASKSRLNTNLTDYSNYFNFSNDCGKNASCCAAMGSKL